MALPLSEISPCCYAGGNFGVLLRLSGMSPCCHGYREFRRVSTDVGNFAASLRRYGCPEFRRVAKVAGKFSWW